jgi:hypothetical protein
MGAEPTKDRILQETRGFSELSGMALKLPTPLFADSFQLISMLKFYQPQIKVSQWPGITRLSEFDRRQTFALTTKTDLSESNQITLITQNQIAPTLPGYKSLKMVQVSDCDQGLRLFVSGAGTYRSPCLAPVHVWYFVFYEKIIKS